MLRKLRWVLHGPIRETGDFVQTWLTVPYTMVFVFLAYLVLSDLLAVVWWPYSAHGNNIYLAMGLVLSGLGLLGSAALWATIGLWLDVFPDNIKFTITPPDDFE